jgi:hypothetical protein
LERDEREEREEGEVHGTVRKRWSGDRDRGMA